MKKRRPLLIVIASISILAAIWSYVLLSQPPQQTLDQRVHDVASQLKCLVCQGESVADSPALLSQQMRSIIRQQLQSGKSEQEVIQYFQGRYGDRILLSPPPQGFTLRRRMKKSRTAPPIKMAIGTIQASSVKPCGGGDSRIRSP